MAERFREMHVYKSVYDVQRFRRFETMYDAIRLDKVDELGSVLMKMNDGISVPNGPQFLKAQPPPVSIAAFHKSMKALSIFLANSVDLSVADSFGVSFAFTGYQFTLQWRQAVFKW